MNRNKTFAKSVVAALIIFISTATFAQQQKTISTPAYSPQTGRIISAELFKKYSAVIPDYATKCKLLPDKNSYQDLNDIELIYAINKKYELNDQNLAELLKAPENAKLAEKFYEMEINQNNK